jgi:putative two-component system response regulator
MTGRSGARSPIGGRVLVVDDDDMIRDLIAGILRREGLEVAQACSTSEAAAFLGDPLPDLVVLDHHLPGRSGQDLLEELRSQSRTRLLPVVMLTGLPGREVKLAAIGAGVTDFLAKPFDPEELALRVRSRLRLKGYVDTLEDAEKIMIALGAAIDARDAYTRGHSGRVSSLGGLLGDKAGLSPQDLRAVRVGGLFHDLGKVAVPDSILLKPGPLTLDEQAVMRRHVIEGRRLIQGLRSLAYAVPVILFHHERMDGTGYPEGLEGEALPLAARVTAIADVYDALTTDRPYRLALSREGALEIMREEVAQGWWDPDLFEEFTKVVTPRLPAQRALGV